MRALGGLVVLYAAIVAAAQLPVWSEDPELMAAAFTFDLTVTAAALTWWLSPPHARSFRNLAFVGGLGLLASRLLLPENGLTRTLVGLGIVIEVGVLALFLKELSAVRRRYVELRPHTQDAFEALRRALEEKLPAGPATPYVAAEAETVSLAVLGAFVSRREQPHAFTAYREGGWPALLCVLIGLLIVETGLVHVMVEPWSPAAAWGLSLTSVYSLFLFLGDFHALRLRPVRVEDDRLEISAGLRWRASVPWASIAEVTTPGMEDPTAHHRNLSVPMPETITVRFRDPQTLHGPLGVTREVLSVGLALDEAERFLALARRQGRDQPG